MTKAPLLRTTRSNCARVQQGYVIMRYKNCTFHAASGSCRPCRVQVARIPAATPMQATSSVATPCTARRKSHRDQHTRGANCQTDTKLRLNASGLQSVLLSAHVRFNGAVLVSFSTCSQCGVHLRHQCSTSSTSTSLSFQCCRVHEEFRQFVAWRDGSLTMVIIGLASSTYSTMEC